MSVDTSFLEDLPSGPLDFYRKQSKINWKQLRVFFEGSEALQRKVSVFLITRYYVKHT